MKQTVRQPGPWQAFVAILMGIGGTAACAAHLVQAMAGQPWSPVIALSAAFIALNGWVMVLMVRFRAAPAPDAAASSPEAPRWWLLRLCISGAEPLQAFVLMTALLICAHAAINMWRNVSVPHTDLILGAAVNSAFFVFIAVAQQRGWMRGVLFDPKRSQALSKRQTELARQREEILAMARQKSTN